MDEFVERIKLLDRWIEKNGWAGYDPYDLKGSQMFLKINKIRVIGFVFGQCCELFPSLSRSAFKISPQINAKAMALFGRGYLNLYRKTGDQQNLDKAIYCLNWLENNPTFGYSGHCWGYPFDWKSIIFIPQGTPSGVATSQAAHAFIDAYEVTREKRYLNIATSCCSFLLHDLKKDIISSKSMCFSYTPIDTYHVHNANLWAASVLLRIWPHIQDDTYKDIALKAYQYTVDDQNDDGSWVYWGPPNRPNTVIDNYHSGFVLECLNIARKVLTDEWIWEDALRKGLDYYKKNLFLDDGTPRLTNNSTYPIDIHSSAQAIITFSELSDIDPHSKKMANKVAKWSLANMQDVSGYFYYRKYKRRINTMPYIRWGQAWMLRAMGYLL